MEMCYTNTVIIIIIIIISSSWQIFPRRFLNRKRKTQGLRSKMFLNADFIATLLSLYTSLYMIYLHIYPQFIYGSFHIHYIISLLSRENMNSQFTSLPMCGFIAQLVEHRTGITEVTGSNPVEALIFFFPGFFIPIASIGNSLRRSHITFITLTSSSGNSGFFQIASHSRDMAD